MDWKHCENLIFICSFTSGNKLTDFIALFFDQKEKNISMSKSNISIAVKQENVHEKYEYVL